MGTSIEGSCHENERVKEGKQKIVQYLLFAFHKNTKETA